MTQCIEAPNSDDIDRIARGLLYAQNRVQEVTATRLTYDSSGLEFIQKTLAVSIQSSNNTYELQCLGLSLGKIFVETQSHYDWWMVEDEWGRDPAVRYRRTSLLMFPQTLISKRVEDGEEVDVVELFAGLVEKLESIRQQHYD